MSIIKRGVVIILSALIFAFFCVISLMNGTLPLSFAVKNLNLSKSELSDCVCEAYLYKNNSGCKIEKLDYSAAFSPIKSGARISDVKGERFFLPVELINEKGYSFNFISEVVVKKLCAKEIFRESGEDFFNVYYYSPNIKNYVAIGENRINLQISQTSAGISLASPVAFGSY